MSGKPRTEQRCLTCGETDPEKFRWHKNTRNGERYRVRTICRSCYNARHKTYASSQPEFIRARNLKKLYGITVEEYDNLLSKQGDKCGGCQAPVALDSLGRKWPVDHDHATGAVRGILCPDCNRALGLVKDSKEVLLGLIRYLEG